MEYFDQQNCKLNVPDEKNHIFLHLVKVKLLKISVMCGRSDCERRELLLEVLSNGSIAIREKPFPLYNHLKFCFSVGKFGRGCGQLVNEQSIYKKSQFLPINFKMISISKLQIYFH